MPSHIHRGSASRGYASGAARRTLVQLLLVVTPSALVAQVPDLAKVPGLTGTLIVTNKTPATATIIDAASGRIIKTLPTGAGPHEIVVTSNGRTAIVSDYGAQTAGSTLTIIDLTALQVVRTVDLGSYRRPHGLVVLPGDSLVAVTSEASRHVVLVRIATGAIAKAIPTEHDGSHMVGVAGDGIRAWTGDMRTHTVSELDLAAGTFKRSIDVPATPEAINVTPDGGEVWVGSNATGKISVINTATGAVTTAAEGFGWPYRVLFSPDAALVLMPDLRREELRFLDRATRTELARLSLSGAGPQGITWALGGRFALLSLSTQGRVAVIDVAARRVVGAIAAGDTPDGVVWIGRAIRP